MRKLIALLATFIVMLVSLGSMPAFADNCTTDSKGVSYCNTQSQSISYGSVTTSTTSVASSDVKGMVNLRFENARGFVTSAGCYKASSFTKVPRGAKCWIPTVKGYKFQNSGRGRNGVRYFFEDYIGSKYSPLGTRFYYDTAHGSWRKQNCGNFVKFSGIAAIPVSQVALVRTFSTVFVTVRVNQTATVRVHSMASCNANGSSASSDAYGSGTATASATASATATTQTQATATASGQAKTTVSNSAQAAAFSAAQVDMYSRSWVSCSSTTSPPPPSYNAPGVSAQATSCDTVGHNPGIVSGTVSNPNGVADTAVVTIGSQSVTVSVPANGSTAFTMPNGYAPGTYTGSAHLQSAGTSASFQVSVAQCTPPQQTPPSITSMTTINDVEMGGTSPNFNVGTVVPLGHSGSLTCSAQYGSFTLSTVSVSGMSTSTFTYVAPNDPTAPNGLTENVTCTVYDSVTGLSAMRSETFPINPRPAPPA